MRAAAIAISGLLLLALVPVASADAPRPGCEDTLSHPEVCYVHDDLDSARECLKSLRRCILGPI